MRPGLKDVHRQTLQFRDKFLRLQNAFDEASERVFKFLVLLCPTRLLLGFASRLFHVGA